MSRMIYHMCRAEEWQVACEAGIYHGSSQDRGDGFIHFSTAEQIAESARRHRAGQDDLVLIVVAVAQLGSRLLWESSSSGALFPHCYGPLLPEEAARVETLPLGPDGMHVFPPLDDADV